MSKFDQLREQIDACRPGSEDLALPELAKLAQAVELDQSVAAELGRSQAFDRAVMAAMHDVSIPSGLAERLLAVSAATDPPASVSLPPRTESRADEMPINRDWRMNRRLVIGGSIALLALLAVSTSLLWQARRPVVQLSQLQVAVEQWLSTLGGEQSNRWLALQGGQPLADFPLDVAISVRPNRWQNLPQSADATGHATAAAYDLAVPGQPPAVLFVVRSSARYLVPPIPTTSMRLNLSRGLTATAWQRKDSRDLFVLVVQESSGQRLEDFLQAPRVL